MGNEYVANIHNAKISKCDTYIDYDKKHFPIRNDLIQSVTFDCSNVKIDPLFALYIRHECEKLQKKKDMMKPRWVHWCGYLK